MKRIIFLSIFSFASLTVMFGQLIERTADKLVIGNEHIQREISVKDKQFYTLSIRIYHRGRNGVRRPLSCYPTATRWTLGKS